MLEAKNIHKSYKSLQVLKGINFSVNKGEIVSIVGASGAGKSTLLHIVSTLDSADKGEVLLNGQNLLKLKDKELSNFRNKNIGFIFQFHNLLPEFTALENVSIPGFLSNRKEAEVKERAKHLLDKLGLSQRIGHKPSELSGGEQQRVAIARALINEPLIIFADEPSGNLDSKNAHELHLLFLELRKEFNQTFVIVTHNEELATMADRKVEMKDGYVVTNF